MEVEYKISGEDQKFIDDAKDEVDKTFRTTIIVRAMELNGAIDEAQPGMAVSYIGRENYFRIVDIKEANAKFASTLEQALNWDALGRGKGGLAGAAVRHRLRGFVDPTRETLIVKAADAKHSEIMREYMDYLANNRLFYSTWYANAWNVLGLATSCFIRECHHWNAQNVRPIKALCGSLSMENELPEPEYRKCFYLAIHPIPLKYLTVAYVKSKDPEDKDISETVRQRLNVPPAGYADFCACGVAGVTFLTEAYASKCTLVKDISEVISKTEEFRSNPLAYNPFANQLGVAKQSFAKGRYNEAMIVLAAYAKSQIGGTLSKSPALNKFVEANQRKVNRYVDAFDRYAQKKGEELFTLLTGEMTTDVDDLPDRLRPFIKLQAQVGDITSDPIRDQLSDLVVKQIKSVIKSATAIEAQPMGVDIDHVEVKRIPIIDGKLLDYFQLNATNFTNRTVLARDVKDPLVISAPRKEGDT